MIVAAGGRQITVNSPTVHGTAAQAPPDDPSGPPPPSDAIPAPAAPAPPAARRAGSGRADRPTGPPPVTGAAAGCTGSAGDVVGAVTDLRGRSGPAPSRLRFAAADLVVVSGLPGSGKSTLMQRIAPGARVDSQDARDRWARRMPRRLPYAIYRPLVRLTHYLHLRHRLRSGAPLVVHDCGTQSWVRRWLAREAARRRGALHLLLLDVPWEVALAGQGARGRRVSRYAFARHRRSVARLVRGLTAGRPPAGCASAVLLDRPAADALDTVVFGAPDR